MTNEIITCKDCKYWKPDNEKLDKKFRLSGSCELWWHKLQKISGNHWIPPSNKNHDYCNIETGCNYHCG